MRTAVAATAIIARVVIQVLNTRCWMSRSAVALRAFAGWGCSGCDEFAARGLSAHFQRKETAAISAVIYCLPANCRAHARIRHGIARTLIADCCRPVVQRVRSFRNQRRTIVDRRERQRRDSRFVAPDGRRSREEKRVRAHACVGRTARADGTQQLQHRRTRFDARSRTREGRIHAHRTLLG